MYCSNNYCLVDVYIVNGGNNYYIAKDVSIPPNSAIELIQGGAKIVLKSGYDLYAVSDTASSRRCCYFVHRYN